MIQATLPIFVCSLFEFLVSFYSSFYFLKSFSEQDHLFSLPPLVEDFLLLPQLKSSSPHRLLFRQRNEFERMEENGIQRMIEMAMNDKENMKSAGKEPASPVRVS